jgi:hypothetical protein
MLCWDGTREREGGGFLSEFVELTCSFSVVVVVLGFGSGVLQEQGGEPQHSAAMSIVNRVYV